MDAESKQPQPSVSEEQQDDFLKERMNKVETRRVPDLFPPQQVIYPQKSKALAVLFSFLPGAGTCTSD